MKTQILTLITALFIILSLASIQALVIDSVKMYPSEIAPGETAVITIGIENDGKNDITNVAVILDLSGVVESNMLGVPSTTFEVPFAPYESSSEHSFDEIEEDETDYAKFEIIALGNAQSGVYKIPLRISYFEDGKIEPTIRNSLIGVTVNSEPIIGVNIEDGLILKGQENEIDIKIINKGLSDVRFLEVEFGTSTYFDVFSNKQVYIGDIDSDDFDTAGFKIYFKDNSPSTLTLPISIVYKDAVNNEYSEEFDLQVKVYTKEKAIALGLMDKNNTQSYIIGVIVLVVLCVVYRKWKKHRKVKKMNAGKENDEGDY